MSCSVTPWASIERGARASYTHGMRLSRFLLSLAVFSGVPAGAQQSSEPKSLMYTTVHLDGDFGERFSPPKRGTFEAATKDWKVAHNGAIAAAHCTRTFRITT